MIVLKEDLTFFSIPHISKVDEGLCYKVVNYENSLAVWIGNKHEADNFTISMVDIITGRTVDPTEKCLVVKIPVPRVVITVSTKMDDIDIIPNNLYSVQNCVSGKITLTKIPKIQYVFSLEDVSLEKLDKFKEYAEQLS